MDEFGIAATLENVDKLTREEEFDMITNAVKKAYENKKYPREDIITFKGNVSSEPAMNELRPYMFIDAAGLQQNIDELVEIKNFNNRDELFGAYANFGMELYNNNIANFASMRKLLKEKSEELERAYFMDTTPIMKFVTHETIGAKVNMLAEEDYSLLCSILCFMNIRGFEMLLNKLPKVYELFTSHNIGGKINEGMVMYRHEMIADKRCPTNSNYLLKRVSRAKKIVLGYEDINYKLSSIVGVLEKGLYDYENTQINNIISGDRDVEVLTKELIKYIQHDKTSKQPSNEQLENWIKGIAQRVVGSGKSKIEDAESIELYLKTLVKHPNESVASITEMTSSHEEFPKCDEGTLNELNFGSFRGWEDKFFKGLEERFYIEYAQRFKRN